MKDQKAREDRFGLYVLGNDGAIEWLRAMIPSIRRWSPHANVHLVPYDERLSKTRQLCQEHGVEILEDSDFETYDQIGKTLAPESRNVQKMFRKMACFLDGPYERFAYLDADTICLAPVEIYDTAIRSMGQVVLYEGGGDLDYCYPRDPLRSLMQHKYKTAAFNAGFFAGVKGLFSIDEARTWARELAQHKSECWQEGMDQPFINYCVDKSGVKRVSLTDALGKPTGFWAHGLQTDLDPAAVDASNVTPGTYRPVIHWATFQVKPYMPLRKLWRHYRLLTSTLSERLIYFGAHDVLERGRHVVSKRARRLIQST
ncbi:hypothetical protein WKW77_11990 [Variovorax ureilyticus]|uniref:Glycosyl transferase family 8 n=1 Tax=Variovorax ureilyticus TaxID=1836198 RepID=A0ABU8VDV9_9BURK